MNADPVVWQGTPLRGPTIGTWAVVLAIILGIFALLYWYMATIGSCVDFLLQEDCIDRGRRGRMEVVFLVLAVLALGALAVLLRTALGFPLERYVVTPTEVRVETGWPLSGRKVQPLAHLSIDRRGDGLRFSGVGEKPVDFDRLPPGTADQLLALILDLKAAPFRHNPQGTST